MAPAERLVGNTSPELLTQDKKLWCFSAALASFASEHTEISHLTQPKLTDILSASNLFGVEKGGVPPQSGELFDMVLAEHGINVRGLYEERCEEGSTRETPLVQRRIAAIDDALDRGEGVIVVYMKEITIDKPPYFDFYTHYARVTGYEVVDGECIHTVMDPDNAEGGVFACDGDEFLKYVAAQERHPIMAFSLSLSETGESIDRALQDTEERPGESLLTHPLWQDSDNGKPVPPGSAHPVSVAMPSFELVQEWQLLGHTSLSVGGDILPAIYPRFGRVPDIIRASLKYTGRFDSLPFPSMEAARQAGHLARTFGDPAMSEVTEAGGVFWLQDSGYNDQAWQYSGLGISSRQARAVLEGRPTNDIVQRDLHEAALKSRIHEITGMEKDDMYFFPNGAQAEWFMTQVMRVVTGGSPAQFDFCYSDSFNQAQTFGPKEDRDLDVHDVRTGSYEELERLVELGADIGFVNTEAPASNPKLSVPNLAELQRILDGRPIVIDSTIGTMFNTDDKKLPKDVVAQVQSLTKFFASSGIVMGGLVALRRDSPHYKTVKPVFDAMYEAFGDNLWYEDAAVLLQDSADFTRIMPIINANAQGIAHWLHSEFTGEGLPLKEVWYPSLTEEGRANYDAVMKAGGGYGGVMTLIFHNESDAHAFYRMVRLTKGPSLGTKYTLITPYTELAHKDEIDTVEELGIPRYAVRISIGKEDFSDLQGRIINAFLRKS